VARVTGLIVSTFPAVYPGPLHYRFLEKEKTQTLQLTQSYQANMKFSQLAIEELNWWMKNVEDCNGKPIQIQDPSVILTTDASKRGWGTEWDNKVRPLVSSGSTFAHQHFGTSSGIFCIASTGSFDTQSTYSCANRQQVSCCLYQSHGRNTFKCNGCNSKKDLVMGIDEKQSHFLCTHPWNGKSTNISSIYTNTISTSSGLVCQQAKSSAGEICGII
jgi:hypothetical protein